MDGNRLSRFFLKSSTTFLLILPLTLSTAQAADVQVRVIDKSNSQPVENISVCLGTSANLKQFGAFRTDRKGIATFSALPHTNFQLTLSGAGRKGLQTSLEPANYTRVLTLRMPKGGNGPVCEKARTDLIETAYIPEKTLKVSGFRLNRGSSQANSRAVILHSHIFGDPTHYRASEDPEFKNSNWLDFNEDPTFLLSPGNGTKKVYYQVRKSLQLKKGGGVIHKESTITSDSIALSLN